MRSAASKELEHPYNIRSFILTIIAGALCAYFALWTRYELFTFILGTISVLSFGFVFYMPFQIYRDVQKTKQLIRDVDVFLTSGEVNVYPVTASRIAVAKESKDEGDLYIIELSNKGILYLWDTFHNMKKHLPANEFEVYSKPFAALIRRNVNTLSEKTTAIQVSAKGKDAYFKKTGAVPEHLSVDKKNFDKLLRDLGVAE